MKERVNQYKFDRISSSMQKEFGTIRQGEENTYDILLFPMEANMGSMVNDGGEINYSVLI